MDITIQELLAQINLISLHSETPALDSQVLLAHFLEKPRSWVLAHPEAQINKGHYKKIIQALHRLEGGEPLPYVIGHWEFFGLDFCLTSDVLIPRPETELLVERGIKWLKDHPQRRRAIDVGTGSGCIGISLAMHIPNLRVLMTDISLNALKVARINAERYKLSDRIEFITTNMLDGISSQYDLICANLPYIPSKVLKELPVAEREPLLALDGGENGTEMIDNLLQQARSLLAPTGLMLLEIEASQGAEVRLSALSLYPASKVQMLKDLSDRDRCLEIERFNLILHICQKDDWAAANIHGTMINKSYTQEGFIHCSTPEQVIQVANRFYLGSYGLVLLWIDPQKISSEIRWEASDGELFPHIYGPIDLEAVIAVTDFIPADDGRFYELQMPD